MTCKAFEVDERDVVAGAIGGTHKRRGKRSKVTKGAMSTSGKEYTVEVPRLGIKELSEPSPGAQTLVKAEDKIADLQARIQGLMIEKEKTEKLRSQGAD